MADIDELFNELWYLVGYNLKMRSPVLSGNTRDNIYYTNISEDKCEIVIDAQSYDLNKWAKTGEIEYTGKYNYASSVNSVGAFGGRSKKSKHWANKVLVDCCHVIAPKYDAEVVVNVEL